MQPTINPNSSTNAAYSQGQFQQKPNQQMPVVMPPSQQQPMAGWQYVNPYATMSRSQAAHYQQQAARNMQAIPEQTPTHPPPNIRRSSTGEDFRSNSISRSASNNDLNYSTNSGAEKIRVRVINDNSSSTPKNSPVNFYPPISRSSTQRSILKSQNDSGNNKKESVRTIYAPPNTEVGAETMQDLLKVVNNQRSDPTQSTAPVKERIIIIDRRGPTTPEENQNGAGKERYRAFEIRSSTSAATPPTPTSPTTTMAASNRATSTPSPAYVMQQPGYYSGPQLYFQQPKVYSSVPNNLYSASTPYGLGANNFYPFGFFRY